MKLNYNGVATKQFFGPITQFLHFYAGLIRNNTMKYKTIYGILPKSFFILHKGRIKEGYIKTGRMKITERDEII
jgi:hypothetical protein